jgi:peroxiredoxin Q/BCP
MDEEALTFSLPNVGPGPDPLTLDALRSESTYAVLLLHRDHYCSSCRTQVQTVADRYEAFRERDAEVVSVLPEPVERAQSWQATFDLPFPLLADPDSDTGDALDQPVRFGAIGRLSDFLGRQPSAMLVRLAEEPQVVWDHHGGNAADRPTVDDLLAAIDDAAEAGP